VSKSSWKAALAEWAAAVNSLRGASGVYDFGEWCSGISFNVTDVDGIIERHAGCCRVL